MKESKKLQKVLKKTASNNTFAITIEFNFMITRAVNKSKTFYSTFKKNKYE